MTTKETDSMTPTPANGRFPLTASERSLRKANISKLFAGILDELGIDRANDPNSTDTPDRVAKMFVDEIFSGRFDEPPPVTVFPNTKQLDEMVTIGPLTIRSMCSHHFMPIRGEVWISYIPDQQLVGLSKFSRIARWIASRPQIQEELTHDIAEFLNNLVSPKGVAVCVRAVHFCQCHRGVEESTDAKMVTTSLLGCMRDPAEKSEFLAYVTSGQQR